MIPFARYRVKGKSMEPTLNEGDMVFIAKFSGAREGDLAVVKRNGTEMVKRVIRASEHGIFVVGDNTGSSTDSRHFGTVSREEIVGKVLFKY